MRPFATRAAARREMQSAIARTVPVPMPIGGMSSEAKRSEVSGVLAETLLNWRSNGTGLQICDGYTQQASDFLPVQRIPFEFSTPAEYIHVLSDSLNTAGSILARAITTPVCHTSISSQVIMVDGSGYPMLYDGTTLSEITTFVCTDGKDPRDFTGVFAHQDRLFFWDDDLLGFWYTDQVGAVTGNLVPFELDRLGNIKGKTAMIGALTINAAHGMNDVLVIVTTTGMVILYEGLNPGDALDWRQLGRVQAAPPVSKFAQIEVGSDFWYLTKRGIIAVRDAVSQGTAALSSPIAKRIKVDLLLDIKSVVDTYGSLSGWQMIERPDETEVILNVPTGPDTFKQYVYSQDDQAWSTSNYPARWWQVFDGSTDFTGTAGQLYRLEQGVDFAGAAIPTEWTTAWLRVGSSNCLAWLRPTIIADGDTEISVTALADHNDTAGDIVQGKQTFTMSPDNPGTGVALNEDIGVGVSGDVFRITFEITGRNLRFENLMAGIL